MDLELLRAQWSGTVPPDYVRPADRPEALHRCCHKRCKNPVAIKKNGQPAKACQRCLDRRARSCKRRRAHFVAQGGCRRCAYRKRLEGDFLCQRCRDDRDVERAQKRWDAIDAAAIDDFAARPETAHRASNSTSALALGTHARSRKPRQPTGRRFRIPSHAKNANGRALCSTPAGGIDAADPAFPAGAPNLAVARPGPFFRPRARPSGPLQAPM